MMKDNSNELYSLKHVFSYVSFTPSLSWRNSQITLHICVICALHIHKTLTEIQIRLLLRVLRLVWEHLVLQDMVFDRMGAGTNKRQLAW